MKMAGCGNRSLQHVKAGAFLKAREAHVETCRLSIRLVDYSMLGISSISSLMGRCLAVTARQLRVAEKLAACIRSCIRWSQKYFLWERTGLEPL